MQFDFSVTKCFPRWTATNHSATLCSATISSHDQRRRKPMTKNPLSKRATRTERTIGQTTHARNASAVRTIAAVACMGAALISTDVRADQYVTLNELIGMSCTGGPPFVGGVTIQF